MNPNQIYQRTISCSFVGRHTLDRKAVSEANFNVAYAPREGYSTLQYPTYRSNRSAYSVHSGTLKSKYMFSQFELISPFFWK